MQDDLNTQQAREHLQMVERILAESSQRMNFGESLFIVWGVYSAVATLGFYFIARNVLPQQALWGQVVLLALAIGFTIWRVRTSREARARRSIVQREFLNVLFLTLGLAFVANVGAFNLFSGMAASAIWSFSEAIVLFFIGMHGNRRAQVCGIAVVVSMVIANFAPTRDAMAYVLAAGMLVGYAGFGVAELLAGD